MNKPMYSSPQQAIKHIVLERYYGKNISISAIDDMYDEVENSDVIFDLLDQIRGGTIETNIDAPLSRHYETKSVASKTPDGAWVGWTYWYGGGKHSDPEEIDWIEDAYFLKVTKEEEVLTVIRTFEKVEE
ncbi:hypothetical protein [Xenorhabdus innexi]|uniref:Uncharacterized protein n=1 Tax=Xenorhabdus innexi TaxID=290109 RepID=A0A1N6N1U3_9GAMM|nr:hypothetical protein [Xenorhabdus innexi]PHM37148.1 hypothetical protein Xinn_01115 [Xenorhabdus innexi]SIP75071.1 conserved hypothetical protein [Xenorhabdus innexi]